MSFNPIRLYTILILSVIALFGSLTIVLVSLYSQKQCNPINPNGLHGQQCEYDNDTEYYHAVLSVVLQLRANSQQLCAILTQADSTEFINCVITQMKDVCISTYDDTDARAVQICLNYAGVLDFGWQSPYTAPNTEPKEYHGNEVQYQETSEIGHEV